MTESKAVNEQAPEIKRPKLLVLTTTYPSSGDDPSGIFIEKLLRAIKLRGYEIKVLAPSNGVFHGRRILNGIETVRFGYFWPKSLEKLTSRAGGIPENMANSWLARIQIFPMMFMFFLKTLVEVRGYDIIYANWLGAGLIGAAVGLIVRKPLVVSFRGDDGYLARERFFWRILTKWVLKRASRIAPVSRELRDIMIDLGATEQKCALPRFGVDTELFYPAKKTQAHRPTTDIIFVGSLIVRKGLHDLMAALAAPQFDKVTLTVIGDGVYADELLKIANSLNINDKIKWMGSVPQDQTAQLMREADLLCLPSYMEGRPNVVNEAMASGIPVITTRIGGIPDMLVEGETAFLTTPGDVDELRKYLTILVNDPDFRKKMGKAGRDFLIRAGVSWANTAEDFDQIFLEVTESD
jgi:glycosyltransferase involved in cell wall biosynthesis